MNQKPDKTPATITEQVQRLREKGFVIDNDNDCESFLSKVSYYRLKAYYLPFKDANTNSYFSGIHFSRIKNIYFFDQKIRTIIFAAIETVEIQVRTYIVNYFSIKYGSLGYKDAANFNRRHDHSDYEKRLKNFVTENNTSLIAKHYTLDYNSRFPMWAIAEFFSIGFLSHFYLDMITQDRKTVAKELYGVSEQILESWLRCLTDLRNKCAHYSRLYYWIFPALPNFGGNAPTLPDYYRPINNRRLFPQLYMLKLMYPDPGKWNADVVAPLAELINTFSSDISLLHIGFPPDWMSQLTK